jgi:hypothetical protein
MGRSHRSVDDVAYGQTCLVDMTGTVSQRKAHSFQLWWWGCWASFGGVHLRSWAAGTRGAPDQWSPLNGRERG